MVTLAEAAEGWAAQTDPSLAAVRRHLFRWGTEYALWWLGEEGPAAARERLTDFAYLQARTATLPAHECTDLAAEYAAVLEAAGKEECVPTKTVALRPQKAKWW